MIILFQFNIYICLFLNKLVTSCGKVGIKCSSMWHSYSLYCVTHRPSVILTPQTCLPCSVSSYIAFNIVDLWPGTSGITFPYESTATGFT